MREILFRGKNLLGKWIEGDLLQYLGCEKKHIVRHSTGAGGQEVIPSTIGEYTGLKDKNDRMIFEGDILRFAYHPEEDVIIEWHDGRFNFRKRNQPKDYGYEILCCVQNAVERLKVIGNIHDNPELLRSEE